MIKWMKNDEANQCVMNEARRKIKVKLLISNSSFPFLSRCVSERVNE